jgi:hypothetical protein
VRDQPASWHGPVSKLVKSTDATMWRPHSAGLRLHASDSRPAALSIARRTEHGTTHAGRARDVAWRELKALLGAV